jgi:UDP-2,4-diacetamido-2,4,6-trideoxy-beta-L-altropyranose hydrolase
MKIVFRVDASLQIGTGHVMRCLTLADALRERGAHCTFICRPHAGHLLELIAQRGHLAAALPQLQDQEQGALVLASEPAHAAWLGTGWDDDTQDTLRSLDDGVVDWLIVDHYALDHRWEQVLRPRCRRLMVIDDLADRVHDCDVLLDQTLGRHIEDYLSLIPASCQVLCGSCYALLRPEFAAARAYSLGRRRVPQLRQLLITMGGVDKDNVTGTVLDALRSSSLPTQYQITVVMGATAPWLAQIQHQVQSMPVATQVRAGVTDMARLMADCDLAIGAAGATSWERCCLGLPSIMLILADNQRQVAQSLKQAGAALLVERMHDVDKQLPKLLQSLFEDPVALLAMSKSAANAVQGHGLNAVIQLLES